MANTLAEVNDNLLLVSLFSKSYLTTQIHIMWATYKGFMCYWEISVLELVGCTRTAVLCHDNPCNMYSPWIVRRCLQYYIIWSAIGRPDLSHTLPSHSSFKQCFCSDPGLDESHLIKDSLRVHFKNRWSIVVKHICLHCSFITHSIRVGTGWESD